MNHEISSSEKLTAAQRIVNTIAEHIENGAANGAKLLTYGVVVAAIVQIIDPAVGTIAIPSALVGFVNIFAGSAKCCNLEKAC